MNRKIGVKISEGACAEVFEWEGNEKIIKLAKANTNYNAMKIEYSNTKIAWDNGLPVPEPFEVLEFDGRWGIVFERVYGETFMEIFMKQFLIHSSVEKNIQKINYEDTTKMTAKVLSKIHSKSIINMSSQRDSIIHSINRENHLTSSEKDLILNILNNIPIKKQLCHGDPNPNNILVRDNKTLVIDWANASSGNPEADLAEYIVMMRFGIVPANIPNEIVSYFDSIREKIIKVFLDEYLKHSNISLKEMEDWILIIAARKLSVDGIDEVEKELLATEIRRRLKNIHN